VRVQGKWRLSANAKLTADHGQAGAHVAGETCAVHDVRSVRDAYRQATSGRAR